MATGRFGQTVRSLITTTHFSGLKRVVARTRSLVLGTDVDLAQALRDAADDLLAISTTANGGAPTAASRVSNNAQTYNLGTTGTKVLTLTMGGVALSLTLTRANIDASCVSPAAATAAELVVALKKAGAVNMGLIPSVSGGTSVALTTYRKGTVGTALAAFAGTLEAVCDFTNGANTAGTGYEPLLGKG